LPQHRYQRDTRIRPDQEALPLQSICAILTRQSTLVQAERNVFSAEVNPQDLVDVALRLGFAQDHVRVVDADMGIGAYDTVISDRPGLQKWLYEDLPSGESLVVLVSQEDRLFRDKWEDQHNAFIRQVAIHGGWVICGQNIYNFRRDWDRDRFRMACKYGRMYIEHHVLQRLHPAAQRAAMQGRYVGGVVSWGYVVDYDRRSETYKRLVPYPPHVALVQEELFRFFASMPQASVSGVVRHWEESGLLFPFYGDDVDPHVVRSASRRKRDDIRGGYVIEYRQVQRALTDVTYLGWRVRQGEVAWDGIKDAPLVSHQPLIDPDLFWYCFDWIVQERPSWAPRRGGPVIAIARPRRIINPGPEGVRFLAQGRVRCAVHHRPYATRRLHTLDGPSYLFCNGGAPFTARGHSDCAYVETEQIESTLCGLFTELLTLDEHDVEALARIADRRQETHGGRRPRLLREIAESKAQFKRAMDLAVQEGNMSVSDELVARARQIKQGIEERERELASLRDEQPVPTGAWIAAQRASALAERIRATFMEWSRQAKARVLALALEDAVLGYVDRRRQGLWVRWQGQREARVELRPRCGKHVEWSEAEIDALQRHYGHLTNAALKEMLPDRTAAAIRVRAWQLGLTRSSSEALSDIAPNLVAGPAMVNTMEQYDFPLGAASVGKSSFHGYSSSASAGRTCGPHGSPDRSPDRHAGWSARRSRVQPPTPPVHVAARCGRHARRNPNQARRSHRDARR